MPRKKQPKLITSKLPHIEGDFDIVGVDPSLRCPGIAKLHYNSEERSVKLVASDILSNRRLLKPVGQVLDEIGVWFAEFVRSKDVKVIVRERSFKRFIIETEQLFKTQGVLEATLWNRNEMQFEELSPMTIKKYVCGNGNTGAGSKNDVARALDNYISSDHEPWRTDDESDAVGVAISWLVINGYIDAKPLPEYAQRFYATRAPETISEHEKEWYAKKKEEMIRERDARYVAKTRERERKERAEDAASRNAYSAKKMEEIGYSVGEPSEENKEA